MINVSNSNVNFVLLSKEQIEEIIKKTVEETTSNLLKNGFHNSKSTTYLTIKEVCNKLSINQSTLYRWTKEGLIPTHKVGGRRLYLLDEINSFVLDND